MGRVVFPYLLPRIYLLTLLMFLTLHPIHNGQSQYPPC
jgi:hypothetical protein